MFYGVDAYETSSTDLIGMGICAGADSHFNTIYLAVMALKYKSICHYLKEFCMTVYLYKYFIKIINKF